MPSRPGQKRQPRFSISVTSIGWTAAVSRVCWGAKLGPFGASWDSVTDVHFRGNDLPLGTMTMIGRVDQTRELFNLALDIEWYSYKASKVATIDDFDGGNSQH